MNMNKSSAEPLPCNSKNKGFFLKEGQEKHYDKRPPQEKHGTKINKYKMSKKKRTKRQQFIIQQKSNSLSLSLSLSSSLADVSQR